MTPRWHETYEGGSPETECKVFECLARNIQKVQLKSKRRTRSNTSARAFHAKPVLGLTNATLRFRDDLHESLRVGFAQPGRAYPTIVRFSNARGIAQADDEQDLRGIALRVKVSNEEGHDLLMTNYPVSHARNARQFVDFALATAGNRLDQVLGLLWLTLRWGPRETVRMLKNVRAGLRRDVVSLALETFWSRGAIRWGDSLAVRYLLRPGSASGRAHDSKGIDRLRDDFIERIGQEAIVFELCVQLFVDETRTPIEDTAVAWDETVASPVVVATLTLPQQDLTAALAQDDERQIETMAFNPWNTTEAFRPLGNLNRARKAAYAASAAHRLGLEFPNELPWRNRLLGRLVQILFAGINHVVPWHRLPLRLSLLNLDIMRRTLQQRNLLDTTPAKHEPPGVTKPSSLSEAVRTMRTYDGRFNDLARPEMGAAGTPYGRNLRPVYRPDLFDTPNPFVISQELLARKTFLPAKSLNILSAAWIQFQVHDWVQHARHPLGRKDVAVPLPVGTTWRSHVNQPNEAVMRFGDNVPLRDSAPLSGEPPLFANTVSHWWDGSEIYGPNETAARKLREGAKLRLTEEGYLPEDVQGMEVTGFNESWWLGLSALHTLFAREHNTVCDALRNAYPLLGDKRIYQTARLIVSALIAKIHTTEWTPAILATKPIDIALNSNWSGPPRDWLVRLGLWLVDTHALNGIPETFPDHHQVPYALTEEFVTVYRLHPLLPDDYVLRDHVTNTLLASHSFREIQGARTDEVMRRQGLANVLYTFGRAHPGAITLHNYPNALRTFERDNGERVDLAVVDLVRSRRRGVPRYNDFRQGFDKSRICRWEDLAVDPETCRLLKEIYKDINHVDTMVGLFAEPPPINFGFSDTAFRLFLLMATRRLQSDRFLTVDFRAEIYTPLGMDWIAQSGMKSVIMRHCPELAALMPTEGTAFAPWRSAGTPQFN